MKRRSVAGPTRVRRRSVPRVISLTLAGVVDVVKLTVFWHSQRFALERSHCITIIYRVVQKVITLCGSVA